MRVLAVGAHPDDLEILCGGTVARLARGGHQVTMCHVTGGDKGAFEGDPVQTAATRLQEARAAAQIAGAEHVSLGLHDGEINAHDPSHRRLFVDLIRDARPDLILTHSPNDYMVDHNEVSQLVFNCSFLASLPLLKTDVPAHHVVPAMYYMETLAGVDFTPVEYVDISEVIDTKIAMLSAHQSQLRWLGDHDGVDIIDQIKTMASFRGYQCGVAYAESFAPCDAWLRRAAQRVLP